MMIKKIILFLFIPLFVLAQNENKRQDIELPDFVITGVQSVSLSTLSKAKPELIPTLSKDFFTPIYSPEELELVSISNPVKKEYELFRKTGSNNGLLHVGVGRYSLPTGQFYLNHSIDHYLLSVKVWGTKIKEYIPSAGYNETGAYLNNKFFVSDNSNFLPGLEISLHGKYVRDSYKFYASVTPGFERQTQTVIGELSFKNTLDSFLNYGLSLSGKYYYLKENGFNETLLNAKSFIRFKSSKFGLTLSGNYTGQNLKNNLSPKDNYSYLEGEALVIVNPAKEITLKGGINYSKDDNQNFFTPIGSMKLKLSDYLTFYAEYNPRSKFHTVSDFIADNRFYNFSVADNVFEKYKISFNGSLKYEFGKYFEIIAGAKYAKIDNYIYYRDNLSSAGFFDLVTVNDVKKIKVYSNANFHLGPFGYFYGEASINDVKDNNGNYIPYSPKIYASLVYGYNFKMGIGFKLKYDFKKDYYTNIANTQIISGYHNFAVSLNYEFIKNLSITLDLENLLNRKNYLWNGYEEKPFDIIAGIDYRW